MAVGLARENHGAAGLAGVVGYLVTTKGARGADRVPPDAIAGLAGPAHDLAVAAYKAHELAKLSVPAGILSGLIAGWLYNRFSNIRLPELPRVLRRPALRAHRERLCRPACWPLCSASAGSWLEQGMDALSRSVLGAGDRSDCSPTAC